MSLKLSKITDKTESLEVIGQGCKTDCLTDWVWKGNTNGNIKGCVKWENVYTPQTTSWF